MQNYHGSKSIWDAESDPITCLLKTRFGLSSLFPYQRLVVTNILEAAAAAGIPIRWPGEPDSNPPKDKRGADTDDDRGNMGRQIVILPTGAGKSLCFQLPAILLGGPTLVIYPLLSLMADQERRLREQGFDPLIIQGGQSREERDALWGKLRSGESRLIIANPEVLLTPSILSRLGTMGIAHIVIDEAHCVSEWGEGFRPAYRELGRIIEAARTPGYPEPLVTAFTATASEAVLEKIDRSVFGGNAHRIIGNPDRPNIRYAAQGAILRDRAVRDLLRTHQRPAIVFCSSRPGTEKLARYLRNEGDQIEGNEIKRGPLSEIRFYHAGLSREEKKALEEWFFTSSQGVLVTTCAYGMGVDKPDIRTVIHRDCPPSVEAYLQESGRAGRDGLPARAILLWGPEDGAGVAVRPAVLAMAEPAVVAAGSTVAATVSPAEARRRRLLDYAWNTGVCRREGLLGLLNYQGDGTIPMENCCDVCEGKARDTFREEETALDFIRRNRRSYRLDQAAVIIARDKNINCGEPELRSLLQTLISLGKIKKSRNILWKDTLV